MSICLYDSEYTYIYILEYATKHIHFMSLEGLIRKHVWKHHDTGHRKWFLVGLGWENIELEDTELD